MAAFAATESANRVWQRVRIALAGADESIQRQFLELKKYLATQKNVQQLLFLTFTDANIIASGGKQLGTGKLSLYGLYVTKTGTAGAGTATKSYVKVHDDATDDTTAANGRLALGLIAAGDQRVYIDPKGLALANGLVLNADTTVEGTTDSTAGDAGPGFAILG